MYESLQYWPYICRLASQSFCFIFTSLRGHELTWTRGPLETEHIPVSFKLQHSWLKHWKGTSGILVLLETWVYLQLQLSVCYLSLSCLPTPGCRFPGMTPCNTSHNYTLVYVDTNKWTRWFILARQCSYLPSFMLLLSVTVLSMVQSLIRQTTLLRFPTVAWIFVS